MNFFSAAVILRSSSTFSAQVSLFIEEIWGKCGK